VELLLIFFAAFGLTYGIKESILFDKPRIYLIRLHPFFYHLFACYLCTGFWAGIIVAGLHYYAGMPGKILLWGLASATASFILNLVANRLSAE
jgi:hypothetical protein